MTKIELIELVEDWLAGGDAPTDVRGRYHQKVIEKYVGMAINNILYDTYLAAKKFHDFSQLDSMTTAYPNVAVLTDTDRAETYSNLPVSLIQLPDSSALRLISPMKDQSCGFRYMTNNSQPVWGELEAMKVRDVPCYYIEGTKVFYYNTAGYEDVTRVLMKIIPPFADWDDDKDIPVIAGKEFTIFEMVTKYMVNKPKDDDINDTNEEQV